MAGRESGAWKGDCCSAAEGQTARRKPIAQNFQQLHRVEREEVYQSRQDLCSAVNCYPIENLFLLCEKEDGLPEGQLQEAASPSYLGSLLRFATRSDGKTLQAVVLGVDHLAGSCREVLHKRDWSVFFFRSAWLIIY